MINELFINAQTKAAYEENKQDIHEDALVFIEDEESIIAKGKTYQAVPSNGVEGRALIYKDNKPQWLDIQIDNLDQMFNNASYDEDARRIRFYHNDVEVASIDATPFIVDNFVDRVVVEDGHVVIKFNSADKSDIKVPITDIFNAENYYTKEQSDTTYVKKIGDTMSGSLRINSTSSYMLKLNSTSSNGESGIEILKSDVIKGYVLYNPNYGISLNNASSKKWIGLVDNGTLVSNAPFVSTVPNGTAPLFVTSTTKVDNLNADMVDGLHSSSLIKYKIILEGDFNELKENAIYSTGANNYQHGPTDVTNFDGGTLISSTFGTSTNQLFIKQYGNGLYLRGNYTGTVWNNWKTIALTDSTVAAANKLATPRTLWGQSFDGGQDVSGDMTDVWDIHFRKTSTLSTIDWLIGCGAGNAKANDLNVFLNNNGNRLQVATFESSGNVGIGTTTPSEKLDVNGNIKTSGRVFEPYTILNSVSSIPYTYKTVFVNTSSNETLGFHGINTIPAGCELQIIINNTGSSTITIAIPTTYKSNGLDSISIDPGNYGEINIISDGTNGYLRAI